MMENVSSNIFLNDDFSYDKFSVELIYKSSISNNIKNWRVFNDNEKIINFLHLEDIFKGLVIDDE